MNAIDPALLETIVVHQKRLDAVEARLASITSGYQSLCQKIELMLAHPTRERRVATESEQGRCGVEGGFGVGVPMEPEKTCAGETNSSATETEPPDRETIVPPRETKPATRGTPEPCDDFAAKLAELIPNAGDSLITFEHFLGSDVPALKQYCERSQGKYKFINASRWSRSKVARFAPDAAQQAAPVAAPSAIAGGASDTVITSTLLKAARRVGEVAALKQVFLTPETRKRARELARVDRRFELTGGGENVRRVAE